MTIKEINDIFKDMGLGSKEERDKYLNWSDIDESKDLQIEYTDSKSILLKPEEMGV